MPTQVESEPFACWFKYRSMLKPFTGKRDGTDAAPRPPEEWHDDQHQQRPPADPHKDNAEVVIAYRCADESGDDGEDEST